MATYDDVDQALLDGIHQLATEAPSVPNYGARLKLAAAAKELAEARAWLLNPNQPHSGSAISND